MRLHLDTAFAFDRDFEDAGFALYPPPLPRASGWQLTMTDTGLPHTRARHDAPS